jgi:hypothetical protein
MSSMYGWESVTRAHLDDMQREAQSAPWLRNAAEADQRGPRRSRLAGAGLAFALALVLVGLAFTILLVV